jgi:hypothetical protein
MIIVIPGVQASERNTYYVAQYHTNLETANGRLGETIANVVDWRVTAQRHMKPVPIPEMLPFR